MVIRPGDLCREGIIDDSTTLVRIEVLRVKMVRGSDTPKPADGTAQIHVVTGHHEAATAVSELDDPVTVLVGQAISDVYREEPNLVEV
jgi:hypothetical protein